MKTGIHVAQFMGRGLSPYCPARGGKGGLGDFVRGFKRLSPVQGLFMRYRPLCTESDSGISRSAFCQLDERRVVEVVGIDAGSFLQGITTNDVLGLGHGNSCAAAFLTAKGRVFSEAIIHKVSEHAYLLDLHADLTEKLMKLLKLYKLRKQVVIADCSDKYRVHSIMPGPDCSLSFLKEKFNSLPATIATVDPRYEKLGYRLYSETRDEELGMTERLLETGLMSAHQDEYAVFRTFHGVAEGLEVVDSIPQEFNFDLLNAINFHKGCYTGQELVARTHFKGIVRKRVLPILIGSNGGRVDDSRKNSTAALLIGSEVGLSPLAENLGEFPIEIIHPKTQKKIGKVHSVVPGTQFGLASIRFDMDTNNKPVLPDAMETTSGVPVGFHKLPAWWSKL